MFKTAVAATAIASAMATNTRPREHYEALFFEHMGKFNLKFSNGAEFSERLQIFANNFDQIEEHNAKGLSYTLGVNQFSHLTFQEFQSAVHIGGTRAPFKSARTGSVAPATIVGATPTEVDWVAAGAVTPVKDQGNCGSCWSFSATGSIEGAYEIKHSNLQSFSEQELVSCDTTDAGCNGGWMDDAFAWAQKNGGITTETAYPYTSGTTGTSGTCKTTGYTNNVNSAPKGWVDVTAGSVSALMTAVALNPVSIAIQANQVAFQSYTSGVLTGKCGQRLDHGVLAVGYGTLNGVDYWKVKNSWGPNWGMGGYILIERSAADLCGVLDAASYPTL